MNLGSLTITITYQVERITATHVNSEDGSSINVIRGMAMLDVSVEKCNRRCDQ